MFAGFLETDTIAAVSDKNSECLHPSEIERSGESRDIRGPAHRCDVLHEVCPHLAVHAARSTTLVRVSSPPFKSNQVC